MRVALVTNSLPPEPATGGAQDYVADLAADLAVRHDVLVLTGAKSGIDGVQCVAVPTLPVLLPTASLVTKAAWHLRDQWRPAVHRAVGAHLRAFRPDVVHTHEPQGLSAAVFSAVAVASLRHVHTTHDLNLLCVRVTMTKDGESCGGRCAPCLLQRAVRANLVARRIDYLIAPSDRYRQLHVRAGIAPAELALTIRHGARAGTARVRAYSRRGLTLGFIGALSPHKGLSTLLNAFERAPAEWRLEIAGDGLLAPVVERAARRDDRIRYHGYVSGAQKDAFFDRVDLLVIPSEWEEAATLVAVEGAVRGLPSVVSDRGGLPETAEARLFSARDASSLLAAIDWFLDSDRLSAASKRLLADRERFLWSTHVARVERVLAAAAGR